MRNRRALAVLVMAIAMMVPFVGCAAQTVSQPEKQNEVQPLWEAGGERNKIVIISDLHLGIDDAYSETVANRP